jgi:hypothetical protein
MTKNLVVAVAAIAMLTQCGLLVDQTARLWTDSVEIAVYVEEYNALDHGFRVELEFLENPPRELGIRTDTPDLVIAEQLASRTIRPLLGDLTQFVSEEMSAELYTDALELGRSVDGVFAIPLSFNLPMVVFYRDSGLVDAERFAVTPDELRQIGGSFNDSIGERFVRMGFSPRWDTQFLTVMAMLRGAEFRETAPHQVAWNQAAMVDTVAELRAWLTETNGGINAVEAFEATYLYDPSLKLLETGRIGAVFATSDEFYEIPESRRSGFSFAWLWDGEVVPVLGSIRYAAVPAEAANTRAAEHFLSWLFDPDVQRELIRAAPEKRVRSFGFAGGVSTLPEVNLTGLSFRYRSLLGAVPQADRLSFPSVLPTYWRELSEDVIEPWMSRAAAAEEAPSDLLELVNAWLLTRGE